MTFRDISEALLDCMLLNAESIGVPAKNIRLGKVGEMPSSAPFLWLFLSPAEIILADGAADMAKGELILFAGDKSKTPDESRLKSQEYLERAFRFAVDILQLDGASNPLVQFDSYYSDIAVNMIQLYFVYQLTEVL